MRLMTATYYIDDQAQTPCVTVEIDGQPQITHTGLDPAEWITAIDALGTAAGIDLRADLNDRFEALVDQLEQTVEQTREDLEARESALAAWQTVPARSQQ